MPRAARICPIVGCPELVYGKDRYCPDHLKERRQVVDSNRLPAAQRGYDAEWQQIRDAYLKAHPWCVFCGRKANEVDHVIPIVDGGTNDWDNLRSMCKHDHSQHTAHAGGGFGNPKGKGVENAHFVSSHDRAGSLENVCTGLELGRE
jgi:5-methylcytosine-specific restriction protein A